MADEYSEEYFEEEEPDWDEEEDDVAHLAPTNLFVKDGLIFPGEEQCIPSRFEVKGDLTGDIDWNNISATITWRIGYPISQSANHEQYIRRYPRGFPAYQKWSCKITPFTNNCGAKALSHLSIGNGTPEQRKTFLTLIESFLSWCCNCSILVGSDFVDSGDYMGSTGQVIKELGEDYTFTSPIWNPNYLHNPNHKIFLFYKYLNRDKLVNHWR